MLTYFLGLDGQQGPWAQSGVIQPAPIKDPDSGKVVFDAAIRIPEPNHRWLDALYREGPVQEQSTGLVLPSYFAKIAERFPGDCLDVGCNNGENASATALLTTKRVWGLDPDTAAIANATKRYGGQGNLKFRVGSAYTMAGKFPDIGSVVCNHALHHLDDLDRALEQMDAVISRRKGLIYLYDFDRDAVARNFSDLGIPRRKLARYYERALAGDSEAFVRTMENSGHRHERILLTYLSWLAAYTGAEVAARLKTRGYRVLWGVDQQRRVFAIQAVKNGSLLDAVWLAWINQKLVRDSELAALPSSS